MASTTTGTEWVILATWTEDGGRTYQCDTFSVGWASEEAAKAHTLGMPERIGLEQWEEEKWSVDVVTIQEAAVLMGLPTSI